MKRNMVSRLIELSSLLKNAHQFTLKELSQRLEVCERTIKRDIRLLRDEYRAPIRFSRVKNTYCLSEEWFFSMPDFTEGELLALVLATVLLKQYRNTPMEKHLLSIEKKIKHIFSDKISLSGEEIEMMVTSNTSPVQMKTDTQEIFQLIFQAIRKRKTLQISYYSMHSNQMSQREVNPYHLFYHQGVWYFSGFCSFRKEVRDFALDRIKKCKTLHKSFEIPEDFNPKDYLQQAFFIYKGALEAVEILFDIEQSRRICERIWHPTQKVVHLPDGRCKIIINANPIEVKRWVLSHGIHAEIIKPYWLRKELGKELLELSNKYSTHKK
jgi:predicted DNA-binding transcriptional regulator YafY